MKKAITILFALILTSSIVSTQTAGQLLKDAIYQEEVNGDLEKAISIYREIVQNHPDERRPAAEALFRLGLTNEKLGQQQATGYYRQVIRQYADQSVIAEQARSRLSFLTSPQAYPGGDARKPLLTNTKLATLDDIYGKISPDGQHISFIHWNNGGNLAIHDIKTGQSRDLTTEGTWAGVQQFGDLSIWSPDSRKIAYTWYRGPQPEMRIFDLRKNTHRTVIPYTEGRSIIPIYWNKDNKIYFISCTPDCQKQFVSLLDVASGKVTQVEEIDMDRFRGLTSFRISPNGKYAAYTVETGESERKTMILPFPTDRNEILSSIENIHIAPVWSADSDGIFYASIRYNNNSLYQQKLKNGKKDGEEQLVLESLPNDFEPSGVNPETGDIYYTSHTRYFLVEKRSMDPDAQEFGHPEVIVNSADVHSSPSYSPDGKSLAYVGKTEYGKDGSRLYIFDRTTGRSKKIDYGFRNIDRLGPTQLQWTHDGRHVVVPFKPLDDAGQEIPRLAFVDASTGRVDILDEDLGRGARTVLGGERIIKAEIGVGLVLYDRNNGRKEVIYSIPEGRGEIWYITPNMDQEQVVFFKGSREFDIWMKELVHLDLKTGDSRVLWSFPESAAEGFSNRIPPNWVGNRDALLLSVVNVKKEAQQYFLLDIASGKKTRIGDAIPLDERTYFTQISPDGKEITHVRQQSKSSAWAIRNIR